eukprot:UN33188
MDPKTTSFSDTKPIFGDFHLQFTDHEYSYYINSLNKLLDHLREENDEHQRYIKEKLYKTKEREFMSIVRKLSHTQVETGHLIHSQLGVWNEKVFHKKKFIGTVHYSLNGMTLPAIENRR